MIKKTIQDALNEHMDAETYSAYLYYSMAAYFDRINLTGMAQWMKVQAHEELLHSTKVYDFLNERGGHIILGAIEQPPHEWDTPLAVFEASLEHEVHVTDRINKLVDLADSESDHATRIFLEWFVSEQVEEEATVDGIIQQLKLVKDSPQGLFMIDRELGQRAPAGLEGGA